MKRKIGILGGTFDPIHVGHLILAERAYYQFGLEEVLIMPSGNPPHKRNRINRASLEERIEMVRLAIEDNPHFILSLDDAHEYHEWSYTTARGETVSVYSGNHQFIVLYNGENAFISLVSQPGDSLGDDEIKAYVESVDLSALDKIGHINLPA